MSDMAVTHKMDPATGFRTGLALADAGIEMKRAQLEREFPDESPEEHLKRLNAWLRERPGAPIGDGEGRPSRFPRATA